MIPMWGATGGLNASLAFSLGFADKGAGIVDLTPNRAAGSGTPTFTRATTAYTKLSTGLWASVASGSPRYCYYGEDTVAKSAGDGGYLCELAATQLVTPTASIRDMTDASWVKVTMTAAKTSVGITGGANTATRLTAAGAVSTILQTLVAAASTRTYSCWMRRVTGTGTILIQQGATTLDVTALINSTTYTLVQLPASVLNSAFGITINTNTDAIDVDFNQFEAGNTATSPLDAAGAARNADVLTYVGSGNINAAQGTAYAEINTFLPAGQNSSGNMCIVASDAVNTLRIVSGQPNTAIGTNDSTTSVTKTGLTSAFTAFRKRACSWGGAGLFATGDGATPASGAFDGSMGAGTTIGVGNTAGGGSQFDGIIRTVKIYQAQLDTAAITA